MNSEKRRTAKEDTRLEFIRYETAARCRGVRAAWWLWLLVAAIAIGSSGQNLGQQQPTSSGQISTHSLHPSSDEMDQGGPGGVGNPVYQERRLRQLNEAQHKAMVSDTDKLLKLVAELNAEIDRTAPSELTPAEVRKVAEIEKLAHSVKEKMRTAVQATPGFMDATPPPPFGPSIH